MNGDVKTSWHHIWFGIGLMLAWPLTHAQVQAAPEVDQPPISKLKVSGFGTLGYWLANGPDDIQFRRELGQNVDQITKYHERADSRLGLQLNYQASDSIELVGQVVAREKANFQPANSVEWAFVKYHPTQDTELRLGRVGFAPFMLSDYRNVGYAYTWVRPPTEFYGWIPFYSVDGVDAVHAIRLGDGQLRSKVFGGQTDTGMPWGPESYHIKAKILGIGLNWESDEWRLRASHTRLQLTTGAPFDQLIPGLQASQPYWPDGAKFIDDLDIRQKRINYTVLGVAWDRDGWQLSSEVAVTHAGTFFAPQGTAAYVSVGHRFDRLLPYVSFARSWDKRHLELTSPPGGFGMEPLETGIHDAYSATKTSQYTASVGMRWDVSDSTAVKVQWDRSVVDSDGTQMWGLGPVTWTGGAKHVWSATLDFTF